MKGQEDRSGSDQPRPAAPEVAAVGVLALQGDFEAHRKALERLGTASIEVRTPADLARAGALILPGGESTAIVRLMDRIGLRQAIQQRARAGMPVYGTCAGMILLANRIQDHPEQPTLGLMDMTVARNAFGRQVDSFEADIDFEPAPGGSIRGVFIRAPYACETGPGCSVLSRFQDRVVGVRQNNLLATAFHPELTDDLRVHEYFLSMQREAARRDG